MYVSRRCTKCVVGEMHCVDVLAYKARKTLSNVGSEMMKIYAYALENICSYHDVFRLVWARFSHVAKVSTFPHMLSKQKEVYRPIPPYHPFTQHHSSRRSTFVASTHDIVKHAVPDLLDDTNLLLDGLLDSRGHEVRDSVKVDAVGVAVVRVRHGQDDGEGRGADDFGFGDDLVDLLAWWSINSW